ncbi:MAG: hypothetical protein ACKO96_28585, partial [Flammeovirgaceae bacterium]
TFHYLRYRRFYTNSFLNHQVRQSFLSLALEMGPISQTFFRHLILGLPLEMEVFEEAAAVNHLRYI